MKSIWKFPLEIADKQVIQIPFGADILCVQVQNGDPYLWAKCEKGNSLSPRKILIYGTGHDIVDEYYLEYIDTFQMIGGSAIFHAFEDTRTRKL